MNTCYAKVVGGVGNQLFIAAAGYAYAKKYNMRFAIDPSNWGASQGRNIIEYKDTLFKNFNFENAPDGTLNVNEKRFNYDELPFYDSSIALFGYFQSLKYFEEVADEFISMLNLPDINTSNLKKNNVAIHIRRGDYLHHSNIHHVCDTEYFKTQLLKFEGFQQNAFTDSSDYVVEEFHDSRFNLIKSNSELLDLAFMSKHENMICSNSSFSWWASFLGTPKNQIIVPDKWFHNFEPHEDIYRSDFIKVKV